MTSHRKPIARLSASNLCQLGFVAIAVVASALALLGASVQQNAGAWYSSKLDLVYKDDDVIRNYDYLSTASPTDNYNLDFPVTMIFKNNAEIDKVKNRYKANGWDNLGSSKYGRARDGSAGFWDSDRGVKTWGLTTCHMRVYADSDDRMYCPSWGYYIFGTTHYDHGEVVGDKWFGKSEDAETEARQEARTIWGTDNVVANNGDFKNYEAYRVQTSGGEDHIWQSSGRRSTVTVP